MAETGNSKPIPAKKFPEDVNDSSSISAGTSINEESVDSDCNERCVVSDKRRISPVRSCDDSSSRVSDAKCDGLIDVFAGNKKANNAEKNLEVNNCESRPLFSVKFRNGEIARKYRKKIQEYLRALIKENAPEVEDCDASDLQLDIWEEEESEDNLPESNLGDDLFTVDTSPAIEDDLDIPTYDKKFTTLNAAKRNTQQQLSTCFNCMGNHNLKDCPKPRDPSAIAKNRKEFMNRHGNFSRVSRYHLEEDQRFATFVPGHASNGLYRALGLAENQLPRYIYHMRVLGYPPGWLEDAKVTHSGITLFDSQGQEVADPQDEEGEIISQDTRDKYDISKIISFPGFNVPVNVPGIKDEAKFYRCPPMMNEHSKQAMVTSLQSKETRAYKRKRLSLETPKKPEPLGELLAIPSDMEVEEVAETVSMLPDDNCRFIPPLPKDTPPRQPPPPSTTESDSEGAECRSQEPCSPLSTGHSSISSPRAQSPSLSDLEAKKRQLLAELEDGGSSSENAVNQKNPPTPSTPNLGRVKSVSLGTPLLKSASPYNRLPDSDKFSKNICDVINFENLPDATGKYEQMTGLIKKVRVAVAKIQNE